MNVPRMFLQTLIFALFLQIPSHAALIEDFLEFSLLDQPGGNVVLPGRLYTPPEATSGPRPLILFLHGGGERGTDNALQVNGNIDNLLAEAKRRGAFLYAPQTTTNWAARAITDRVMTMIDRSKVDFSVASDQVYVTGLSLGGGGTWNLLNRYGDTFAAGIPIAGVPPTNDYVAANLVDEPLWVFHAKNDGTVSVTASRTRVDDILVAGGQTPPTYNSDPVDFYYSSPTLDLQYTEFSTGGHAIWSRVYSTPAVYDWLFSRTSAVPEPSSLNYAIAALFARWTMRRRKK